MRAFALLVLFASARPAHADCDSCEDLCRLMDQYLQKSKAADAWRELAMSTPQASRRIVPGSVKDMGSVETFVNDELTQWLENRQWTGEMPCPTAGVSPGPATELETQMLDPGCHIIYNKQILQGDNLKKFVDAVGCKAISDSQIAHENVHRDHCLNAFKNAPDDKTAVEWIDRVDVTAESEMRAYSKARDMLANQIRDIIRKEGCGWDFTKHKNDPKPPTPLEAMQEIANKAGFVLRSKGPKK
jgi:hypothetical protein